MLVHYERLLEDPARELERICAVAGLAGEQTTRALDAIAARHRFADLPDGERGSGCRERAAQPGAWRLNLTAPEQDAMHRIMGDELRRAGYAEDRPGVAAGVS